VTAEKTRATYGVEDAYRDARAPRLLVIRVGSRWYECSEADRRAQAQSWHQLWRKNVPEGIVSILDAKTNVPVVRFDRDGEVAGLLAKRPAEEEDRGDQP